MRNDWIAAAAIAASSLLVCGTAGARGCADLATVAIDGAQIRRVGVVDAGTFTPPGSANATPATSAAFAKLPSFCRVQLTARPSMDSEIAIEVWLPGVAWNGKLQSVGNGGWAGAISYPALATALAAGYAAASTDTGHAVRDATFILGHPEKVVDFGHRAVHAMTGAAKHVVDAYYGRGATAAYFNGCSTGGRQALAEAQRYPDDYDGIVAGAAAYHISHLQGTQLWTGLVGSRDGGAITKDTLALVNRASVAACDALDGVADGVIENPTACTFDPAKLVCAHGESHDCLSAEQAETVNRIYAGPTARSGQSIYPGYSRGSELGWVDRIGPEPPALAVETYRFLVYADPNWDYRKFDVERDTQKAVATLGPAMNSTDPNLAPFFAHGGKLLLYHGWNDPGVPPLGTVNYYENVVAAVGATKAATSVRLFMVPGMNHCRGGVGTDDFDPVAPLDAWVARGAAPKSIVAAHRENGAAVRTRPLCPFPQVAVYSGSGSTDDAANFRCTAR